jgi:hypothetical protein
MATKTNKTLTPRENIEGSEGLAPIARLILKEGFHNEEFHKLYGEILEISNLLADGEVFVPKGDVDWVIEKIEEHKSHLEEYYSPEVQDIMRNYFIRFSQNLREWHIKSQTPDSIEELNEAP